MVIPLKCTGCNRIIDVPDSFAGKKGKCPYCLKVLDIPALSSDADVATLPPLSSKPQRQPQDASDESAEGNSYQDDSLSERGVAESDRHQQVGDLQIPPLSRKETGLLARIERALDFSFNRFLSVSVIQLIYGFGIILCVIAGFITTFSTEFILSAHERSAAAILLLLLLGAIVSIVYFCVLRLTCEMLVVVFRIAENTSEIVKHLKRIEIQTHSDRDAYEMTNKRSARKP